MSDLAALRALILFGEQPRWIDNFAQDTAASDPQTRAALRDEWRAIRDLDCAKPKRPDCAALFDQAAVAVGL